MIILIFRICQAKTRAQSRTVDVSLDKPHEFRFSAQVIFAAWTLRAKPGFAKIEPTGPTGKSLDLRGRGPCVRVMRACSDDAAANGEPNPGTPIPDPSRQGERQGGGEKRHR
jgi:hypothetical protein